MQTAWLATVSVSLAFLPGDQSFRHINRNAQNQHSTVYHPRFECLPLLFLHCTVESTQLETHEDRQRRSSQQFLEKQQPTTFNRVCDATEILLLKASTQVQVPIKKPKLRKVMRRKYVEEA